MQENSIPSGPLGSPLKVKDVAVALGVDVSTVYVAVRTGILASFRVGVGRGTIRIPRAALKAYADERGIPADALGVAL
ncbi:helix-turn-helix domain-containing protein [Streptomyces sp. NPDC048577]|uniref:helix-turn-helix domain-containing protein n=1 Tax=Streptomyces sp. NPDC048577 TaxID=3157209 RepID=UPI00343A243C